MLMCCPGLLGHLHQHHATAFAPCPAASITRSRAAAGAPHAALAGSPCSTLRRRHSSVVCAGDRTTRDSSRAMFNSVVLLPPRSASSATALAGSKLANAIFHSSGGSSSQGSPGMHHGLVEALQPLLSYLVVLLRSMSPSPLELKLVSRLFVAAMVGMFIGTERRTSHRPAGVRTM